MLQNIIGHALDKEESVFIASKFIVTCKQKIFIRVRFSEKKFYFKQSCVRLNQQFCYINTC